MENFGAFAATVAKWPYRLISGIVLLLAHWTMNLVRNIARRLYQAFTIMAFYIVVAITGVVVLYSIPILFGLVLKVINAIQ